MVIINALEDSKVLLIRKSNEFKGNCRTVFILLISGLCNLEIFLFLVVNIVYESLLFARDLERQSCAITQYLLDITHYLASGSGKISQNNEVTFDLYCMYFSNILCACILFTYTCVYVQTV